MRKARVVGLDAVDALHLREMAEFARMRFLGMNDVAHRRQLWGEHRRILDALIAGDGATAEAVMTAHVRGMLGHLTGPKAAHRAYFA